MAQQVVNVGTAPNSGNGDPIRVAFQKTNANTTELYSSIPVGAATFGTDSGVVNAYVFTHSGTVPVTLAAGTLIRMTVGVTNTGAVTVNADGTGAVSALRANGSACTGGEFSSLGPVVLQSTGTQWQIVSTAGAQPGFERTAAEATASVVPLSYVYEATPLPLLLRYGGDVTGIADSRTALNSASTVNVPFRIPSGTYLVNSNVTISPSVVFDPGAVLRPANGVTITLTSAFQAGDYQIFDYSLGGLVILPGQAGIVRTSWWGSQPLPSAKVNNEVPFNQAWISLLQTPPNTGVANGDIIVPRGVYLKSASSYHSNGISFIGEGRLNTLVKANAATWANGNDNGTNMFRSQRADPVLFTVAPSTGATTGSITVGYPGVTNTSPAVAANLAIVFFQRNGAACEIHRIPSITSGATTITWTGGLAANCAFYAAILDEQAIFENRVEHLRINGGDISLANLPRLLYCPAWQQQSGPFDVYFEHFNGDGIFMDQGYGGAFGIRMRQLQFAPNADANGAAIHMNFPNYAGPGYYSADFEEISCSNVTAAVTTASPIAMPLTFTASLAATATSGTLNANWPGTTGSYLVFFVETAGGANEMRTVTLTNGQTTATWTGGLTNACNATTAASNNATGTTGVLSANWPFSTGVWLVLFSEDGTGGGSAGSLRPRMVTLTNGATTATWQGDLAHTVTASASGVTPNFSCINANGAILMDCLSVHNEWMMNCFQLQGLASVTGNSISVGGNQNVATMFKCLSGWTGYIKTSGVTPGGVLNLINPDSAHFYGLCNFMPPDGELVWPPVPTRSIASALVSGGATPALTFSYNMASVSHIATSQQRLTVATPAAWSSTTIYYPGQSVSIGGLGYICIVSNVNQTPPNATYWTATGDGATSSYGVTLTSGDAAVPMIYYNKVNAYQFDVITPGTDAADFFVEVYHKT